MLQVENQFPFPGSLALFQGLRWRVQQHVGEQALISRVGVAAGCTRRAPIAELVDPALADKFAIMALTDTSEASRFIGLFIARELRDENEIALSALHRRLMHHAHEGRIPAPRDNAQIAQLLRRLGWRKQGLTGEGWDRSPLYVRTPHAELVQ